jgi:poly(3-hydroxybutyrate) depolymerase
MAIVVIQRWRAAAALAAACFLLVNCDKEKVSSGPECGNGIVDDGELCDGDCPTSCDPIGSCQIAELVGSAEACDAQCLFTQITDCDDNDGCCPMDCDYRSDADCAMCDSSVGMTIPVPLCTQDDPCTNLLPTYELQGITEITEPTFVPVCRTSDDASAEGRPFFDDGPPQTWVDVDGTTRYWCESRPAGTSSGSQRPLVIYVHGSGGTAATVYDYTLLRGRAVDFDLTGDPARPGFILVSTQGRNLHWPTADPQDGSKHDAYHRNMSDWHENRDFAFVDHIIDSLTAEGVVDDQRIYIMGWSNGARFAGMYGISRYEEGTLVGGHPIAAVANYSGGDPYENIQLGYEPSCKQDPYPSSTVPFLLVSRSCDGVACNEDHAAKFRQTVSVTPGNVAETWVQTLRDVILDPNVEWWIISGQGVRVRGCAPTDLCTISIAVINHVRWPDGIDDNSGIDHEPDMLTFLRDHPFGG